ncbi:DUF4190 domain-containing protein [Modestobacter sp. I12A-02662]|uniref:DUF4190 domain-containing protein n=1 Tax=Modestobacter sp. I12A-02662 TaxID=1730496 RepID=UPI0034DE318E
MTTPSGPQHPQSPGHPVPSGQYGQPAPYGGYGEPPRSTGLGIAALVLGILSLPGAFLVGVPGIVLGLIALVLGIVALRRVEARRADNRGMAITGVVTGALGLLLGVLGLLLGVLVLAGAVFFVRTTGDCTTEFDQTGDQARHEQCLRESVEG